MILTFGPFFTLCFFQDSVRGQALPMTALADGIYEVRGKMVVDGVPLAALLRVGDDEKTPKIYECESRLTRSHFLKVWREGRELNLEPFPPPPPASQPEVGV